jgi:hypothetical protein
MREDIGVGVSEKSGRVLDQLAAEDEFPAVDQAVDIVSDADAKNAPWFFML